MDLLKYPKMMKTPHCESSSNKKKLQRVERTQTWPKKTQTLVCLKTLQKEKEEKKRNLRTLQPLVKSQSHIIDSIYQSAV